MKFTHFMLLLFLLAYHLVSCQSPPTKPPKQQLLKSRTESYVTRLHPYQDIMTTLTSLLTGLPHKAITISSATGSVLYCYIRFANQPYLTRINGTLEIFSLTGTFDRNLNPHVHIGVADRYGNAYGGHLPSLKERANSVGYQEGVQQYDCPIFTTLELAITGYRDVIFERKLDPETTYDQLTIRHTNWYNIAYGQQEEVQQIQIPE